jgi:hypothetical protein
LRRPHLVLPHTGDNDGIPIRDLTDTVDYILRDKVLPFPHGCWRVPLSPFFHLIDPVKACPNRHFFVQIAENVLDIPHNRNIHSYVLADFSRVNIDVDDPRFGSKIAHLGSGPIIKSHADCNDKVSLIHCHVGTSHTMHT